MKRTKQFLLGSRKRVVLTSVIGVFLVSGIAFAAWTVLTSSGSGSGKIGQLVAPTVTDGTPTGDIYPSAGFVPSGSLSLHVDNPNPGALVLTGFTLDDNNVFGGVPGCDNGGPGTPTSMRAEYLYVAGQNNPIDASIPSAITGLSIPVPPGSSEITVPNMIGLTEDAPTECQGLTLNGFDLTGITFSTS